VIEWLKAYQIFEKYAESFLENDIDGFALLNLTDEELKTDLKVTDENDLKEFKTCIRKLVALWVRFGRQSEAYFRE